MKTRLPLAGACAAFGLLCSNLLAVPVVDQSQYSSNTGFPFEFTFTSTTNYPLGQSFTAGLSGLLTNVAVSSNGQISSGGNLTMEIRSGDGTGGILLGSLTTAYPFNQPFDFANNIYPVDIDVSSLGINVAAGLQYTFLFTNVTGSDFPIRGVVAHDQNPYSGGRAYSGPGYGNFVANWDLAFYTKVDQQVPDAGSVFWMLLGSLGLFLRFRRSL